MGDVSFNSLELEMVTSISITEHPSGTLEHQPDVSFSHQAYDHQWTITIEQNGIRRITVITDSEVRAMDAWKMAQEVQRLYFIFEGSFLITETIEFYYNDCKTAWSDDLQQYYLQHRMPYYYSADYTSELQNYLLSPALVLTGEMYDKWVDIEKKMDIAHIMVLYSMADTKLPPVCKCLNLIEVYKPLGELLEDYFPAFQIPRNNWGRIELKKALLTCIDTYGTDIFKEEIQKDINSTTQVFVNHRNRMAHIRSEEEKDTFNGEEAVLYAVKLSIFYRRLLLELLGVDYSTYQNELISLVNYWDQFEGILSNFLSTKVGS